MCGKMSSDSSTTRAVASVPLDLSTAVSGLCKVPAPAIFVVPLPIRRRVAIAGVTVTLRNTDTIVSKKLVTCLEELYYRVPMA